MIDQLLELATKSLDTIKTCTPETWTRTGSFLLLISLIGFMIWKQHADDAREKRLFELLRENESVKIVE